jgi:hypothetical protein
MSELGLCVRDHCHDSHGGAMQRTRALDAATLPAANKHDAPANLSLGRLNVGQRELRRPCARSCVGSCGTAPCIAA